MSLAQIKFSLTASPSRSRAQVERLDRQIGAIRKERYRIKKTSVDFSFEMRDPAQINYVPPIRWTGHVMMQ
jgi:hypothetical protein